MYKWVGGGGSRFSGVGEGGRWEFSGVILWGGVGWGGRRRGVCVKGPGLTRVGI